MVSLIHPAIGCAIVAVLITLCICGYESYLKKPRKVAPVKPHPDSIKWMKEHYASKGEPVPEERIAQGYEQNDVTIAVGK